MIWYWQAIVLSLSFSCVGDVLTFVQLQHQGQQFLLDYSFAGLNCEHCMEHGYASNDQRVIIGLSDCSLLFSIDTFHTNSFLCRPVAWDCAEVICIWTLQFFRWINVSATLLWWLAPATAAVGGGGGSATPPPAAAAQPPLLAAAAQPHPCRRRRRCDVRWGPGWPRSSGSATFWAEH